MAEIEHPLIDLNRQREGSLARIIAEETFQILLAASDTDIQKFGRLSYSSSIGDYIDLYDAKDDIVTLRIRTLGAFAHIGSQIKDRSDLYAPTSDYLVLDMECGRLDDEIEYPEEEDFGWQSYMRIIINTHDSDDVTVINGVTYQEFTQEDLGKASFIIAAMRQQLRGMVYENDVSKIAQLNAKNTQILAADLYGVFDPEDYSTVAGCIACGNPHTTCEHKRASKN